MKLEQFLVKHSLSGLFRNILVKLSAAIPTPQMEIGIFKLINEHKLCQICMQI